MIQRLAAAVSGLAALALVAPAHGTPNPEAPFAHHSFRVMGTTIDVTVPADERRDAAINAVTTTFERVDARMSEWKPSSPLSAVNEAAGGAAVPVPADLRDLIRRGLALGAQTEGAFDVTWAALWGLWDFKASPPRVPSAAEIAGRLALVDYRKVTVDDDAGTVRLAARGMKLGLGGIAKGHALDVAARRLRDLGVRDFLISAGGQVIAGGTRGGRPWRVGIRDPRGPADDAFALVDVGDASLSTSGDYERFFVVDGTRYHHILDPRTGQPSRGIRSATVISPDATLADALSTALMVLGPARGLAAIQRLQTAGETVEAVMVDARGGVLATPGIAARLTQRHPPRP